MENLDVLFGEYRLTKAEITYQESGRPHLLQSVVWEDYDIAPDYPELKRFLDILALHLDGTVQAVRVFDLDEPRPPNHIYPVLSTALH